MKEIEDIGSRLGLSRKDVDELKRGMKRWKIIFWIAGIIAAVVAFILGLIIGLLIKDDSNGGSGYPYSVTAVGLAASSHGRLGTWHLPLYGLMGFLTGLSNPVFGDTSIDYGVFNREGGPD